jgi:type I restriction enzyme M protein
VHQRREDAEVIESGTTQYIQKITGKCGWLLKSYWDICPSLKSTLFRECRPNYFELAVEKAAIKTTIYNHSEFSTFINGMNAHFKAWRDKAVPTLKSLTAGCHPKEEIFTLSEGLLTHYADKPLVNKYDVYQHLMDYWADVMQDDAYLISADGWKAETYRIIVKDKKGKEKDKGWICDLIPKSLVVSRFFANEQQKINHFCEFSLQFYIW